MASKGQVGYKCRIAAVFVILLASIAALVAVTVIQDTWVSKTYTSQFGVVIDSGSSRSTVYLYEWPGEKQNETGVVKEISNCKVAGDGISEMKGDEVKDAAAMEAFQVCMDKMVKIVPAEKHKSTTLFLGATAGMRLLQEKDAQRAKDVMTKLTKYLKSLPFAFQNASIITGQDEGLYGWITVNYLKGNFLEKNLWNKYVQPAGAKTVGSMDLGGASTQLAFAVEEGLTGPDYLPVKLYGYAYNVYTHSYLCYGKNEAEKKVLAKVIEVSSDPDYILNPCYPTGFNITLNALSIYDTTCTTKPTSYNPDQKFFMVGSGNSEECESIVKSLFDFSNCSLAQCSFNGVEQPPVTGDFMAYAGFFYTNRALAVEDSSSLDKFSASVTKLCTSHWEELRATKTWISDRYLKTYCYAGHYVFTLLADGYKFDHNTWKNIQFEKEVKNTSVGWSLGYMLSASNMIPSEGKDGRPLTNPTFAGLVFLFSALIIITVVCVFIILIRTCY